MPRFWAMPRSDHATRSGHATQQNVRWDPFRACVARLESSLLVPNHIEYCVRAPSFSG